MSKKYPFDVFFSRDATPSLVESVAHCVLISSAVGTIDVDQPVTRVELLQFSARRISLFFGYYSPRFEVNSLVLCRRAMTQSHTSRQISTSSSTSEARQASMEPPAEAEHHYMEVGLLWRDRGPDKIHSLPLTTRPPQDQLGLTADSGPLQGN
ncbi:hypothetical protein BD779DRAFT_113685 [Infundibulicybe gibba]|nr:hypothetical protein BD779DRAFT_113685 [Infundibulicybe gibba]